MFVVDTYMYLTNVNVGKTMFSQTFARCGRTFISINNLVFFKLKRNITNASYIVCITIYINMVTVHAVENSSNNKLMNVI